MSDGTKIEWSEATWNPVTGCTKVSPGCNHCYAATFSERFRGVQGHYFEQGFDVQYRWPKLEQPLRWKRPRRIFVNSMSDLFHDEVSDAFIAEVFAVMAKAPQHVFQLLTKRHGRMRSLLSRQSFRDDIVDCSPTGRWPLPNLWLGVSVEDQKWAGIRIPALIDTPAAVRWLSCEPLLGPIDLNRTDKDALVDGGIDWVVCGGESGPGARPMHPDWARGLRDQCVEARVPFFFKQWGEWAPTGARGIGIGQHAAGREALVGPALDDMGHREVIARIGKKRAGRELDGRTWEQYPDALVTSPGHINQPR